MIKITKLWRFVIFTNCPILRYGFINNKYSVGLDIGSVYFRFKIIEWPWEA